MFGNRLGIFFCAEFVYFSPAPMGILKTLLKAVQSGSELLPALVAWLWSQKSVADSTAGEIGV